ncbi:MAG: hypothetical protein IPH98_07930 [Saprospiraceae bacterium]|nr:hypothetical protein [Candidatus Defluviibacterium haderslevense]
MASLTGGVTSTAFYPTSAQQWRKLILMNTFESIFKTRQVLNLDSYLRVTRKLQVLTIYLLMK